MSLQATLRAKVKAGRKLLVPYVCAGHPGPETTLPVLAALAAAGADAIELGIPFSDPLADGPVIQAAGQQALRQGMTLRGVLDLVFAYQQLETGVPLLLMGYVNPLLRMGPEVFGPLAKAAGVAALLVPDLPPESQGLLHGVACPPLVQFAAPNTEAARLETLLNQDPPFVYGVAVYGVTGVRQGVSDHARPFLSRIRAQAWSRAEIPVLAGFGVSTPEQAVALAEVTDGVIVGSALLRALDAVPRAQAAEAAHAFLAPFRASLDAVTASLPI